MENLKYKYLVESKIEELNSNPRFIKMKEVNQHGTTTVYGHSIKVAYLSCKLASKFKLNVNYSKLIKGALLHDYFLYDRKDNLHEGFHGFTHAKTALKNAKQDYGIDEVEADIILKHMFPLNIKPPKYKESWIVCIADTLSAAIEFFEGFKEKLSQKLVTDSRW